MTIRMFGSFLLLFVSLQVSNALLLPSRYNAAFVSGAERRRRRQSLAPLAARYGPPPPDFFPTNGDDNNNINDQKDQSVSSSPSSSSSLFVVDEEMERKFLNLLQQVMTASKPEHIPGLLTRHLDFLFSLTQPVLDSVIRKAQSESDDEQLQKQMLNAIELVVGFLDDFVEQAQHMDLQHKELLGDIISTMRKKDEVELDRFFQSKQKQLTPGFLRHIEGECERVANAPKMTKESSRLLQLLYTIQARVLEELGKGIGEGALVLGQLLGYEDIEERVAVLEAGLRVRGRDFALHMQELTREALEGFQTVPDVEEELVMGIEQIDRIIGQYLVEDDARNQNAFQ